MTRRPTGFKLHTILLTALLLIGCAGDPTPLEEHVVSIHSEYLTVLGLADVDPFDGGPGYGDFVRNGPDCNLEGSMFVAFRERLPSSERDLSSYVEFTSGSPRENAEKVAQHLIDTGWDIQRYDGSPNSDTRIIVGHREANGYSDYIEARNGDTSYNAVTATYANCDRRLQEATVSASWVATDSFN